MARIRTQNEIVASLLDFYRVAQPRLDTKPGTVSRDLFVEGIGAQIARLYDELGRVSALQSFRLALGIDLDRLGENVGAKRIRGAKSTGTAVLTFNSLEADFSITKGNIIYARNGATFSVLNSTVVSTVLSSQYKATAAKYKSDLDYVGITDSFAIEVLVEATTIGVQGNISKYTLSKTSIVGIDHVLNAVPFGGGRAVEDDSAFRNRILAIFSGANVGTETGYQNAVKNEAVIDAIVITPGDSLMTRDGTQVNVAEDGTRTIISEGTGGKVDVIVYGVRLQEAIDSFVYRDRSNTGDPTNPKNDFVLGQIADDENKTVTKKRLDNLATGILPNQPVNNIIEVTGSVSGGNFIEKSTDELGRVSGNYELIRDTGVFGGSPWGFDRLRWISDRIDFAEDKTKQLFNGQDGLNFSDVLSVDAITQSITVANENSKVIASDRSLIQLSHFPVMNVTRVTNVTTGERYTVVNQNPDGGNSNVTGRIKISGRSLPAVSDTLQVDYTWMFSFDRYFDYDDRTTKRNPRAVRDSVDWGFSNVVRRELGTLMASGSNLNVTVAHPISSVVHVNSFTKETSTISVTSGRLVVITNNSIENIVSIIRSDGAELWDTPKLDGTFKAMTAFLPSDTQGQLDDTVTITYNAVDVFNGDVTGSFNGTVITIPSSSSSAGTLVECTYIANVSTLLPATLLTALPAIRNGNAFSVSGVETTGTQPTSHTLTNGVIQRNIRLAPTNLGLTISGSISPGVITVTGVSITSVFDSVFTVSSTGLTHNLSSAIKKTLQLSSKASIPANIKVVKIAKVEKVSTTNNFDVLSSDYTYDIKGYRLADNSFTKDECITDSSLSITEFALPTTVDNEANAPKLGERLRVTFYFEKTNDSENILFSKSGTLYTNKRFLLVDTIAISSGFSSGGSGNAILTVTNLNQPITRSRYRAQYKYIAPKTNERINIRFNADRLITDSTLAIERARPINADVLVKTAVPILIDVTMKISVTTEFSNNKSTVVQNVTDAITAALNATALSTKIDSSDLVNQAYTVNGVDSARVTYFNRNGKTGSVLNAQAQKNEFLRANVVTIQLDS